MSHYNRHMFAFSYSSNFIVFILFSNLACPHDSVQKNSTNVSEWDTYFASEY